MFLYVEQDENLAWQSYVQVLKIEKEERQILEIRAKIARQDGMG